MCAMLRIAIIRKLVDKVLASPFMLTLFLFTLRIRLILCQPLRPLTLCGGNICTALLQDLAPLHVRGGIPQHHHLHHLSRHLEVSQ